MKMQRHGGGSQPFASLRRLTPAGGLALAVGLGSVAWGGMAEGAHLLGFF